MLVILSLPATPQRLETRPRIRDISQAISLRMWKCSKRKIPQRSDQVFCSGSCGRLSLFRWQLQVWKLLFCGSPSMQTSTHSIGKQILDLVEPRSRAERHCRSHIPNLHPSPLLRCHRIAVPIPRLSKRSACVSSECHAPVNVTSIHLLWILYASW